MLAHLRRPFLVMRTYSSFNHPGPMKKPTAILLRRQPERLRMGTIRRSCGPAWAATRAGPFLTEQSLHIGSRSYKDGWSQRAFTPVFAGYADLAFSRDRIGRYPSP